MVGIDDPTEAVSAEVVWTPSRRAWWGLGVLAALALAGTVVMTAGRDAGRPTPATTATTATPTTLMSPAPAAVTSAAPAVTRVAVGPGPLLAEVTGVVLVAEVDGRLQRIDLDTGVMVDTGISADQISAPFSAVAGGVVVEHTGRTGPVFLPNDAETLVALSPPPDQTGNGHFLGEGPPGRLWLSSNREPPASVRYMDRVGALGGLTDVPNWGAGPLVADGLGGLVFNTPTGMARVLPDGEPVQLGPGSLFDARGGFALEARCEDTSRCDLVRHDLRSGTADTVAHDLALAEVGLSFGRARLSPDGAWVVLTSTSRIEANGAHFQLYGPRGAHIEFEQQQLDGCVTLTCAAAPTWSPDSRWLFGIRNPSTMWAWRVGSSTPVAIALSGPSGRESPVFNGPLVATTT